MQLGQFETFECIKCFHWSTTNNNKICFRCEVEKWINIYALNAKGIKKKKINYADGAKLEVNQIMIKDKCEMCFKTTSKLNKGYCFNCETIIINRLQKARNYVKHWSD